MRFNRSRTVGAFFATRVPQLLSRAIRVTQVGRVGSFYFILLASNSTDI